MSECERERVCACEQVILCVRQSEELVVHLFNSSSLTAGDQVCAHELMTRVGKFAYMRVCIHIFTFQHLAPEIVLMKRAQESMFSAPAHILSCMRNTLTCGLCCVVNSQVCVHACMWNKCLAALCVGCSSRVCPGLPQGACLEVMDV